MNRSSSISTCARCLVLFTLLVCLASVGCQSGAIEAKALSAEFIPPLVVDVQTLNLSRLAAATFRNEQIGTGDTLEMQVVTGAEDGNAKTWPLVVQRDGSVDVPLVGKVSLAGLDVDSARQRIVSASVERGIYRQPTVTLQVDQRRTNHVSVVGAVKEPGNYQLPVTGSDLMAALIEAGGLSDDADTVVEILKASPTNNGIGPSNTQPPAESIIAQVGYEETQGATQTAQLTPGQSFEIDLVAATNQPTPTVFTLGDGDVVTVRRRPARFVQVIGLVKRPDRIRIPTGQNPRVLDAIAMAGGVTQSIADRVLIVRKVPGRIEPVTIAVSLGDAKQSAAGNPILADGDVVSVEETPVTFALSAMKHLIRIGVNSAAF